MTLHLQAEFFRTYVEVDKLPQSLVPEVAFLGRSNAGKSSLLNALLRKKGLARTSSTPGRTQALNFFSVSWGQGVPLDAGVAPIDNRMCFFVDVPGYGFAKVSRKLKHGFQQMTDEYIHTREQLALLVLVCDCRRLPEDEERYLLGAIDAPIFIALTKADKLSGNERAAARRAWEAVTFEPENIFFCSSTTNKSLQLDNLRQAVLSRCENVLGEP